MADITWWIAYLIPATIGLWGGWWLRGIVERDKEQERQAGRERVSRYIWELERAKQRHPAYRAATWEWDR